MTAEPTNPLPPVRKMVVGDFAIVRIYEFANEDATMNRRSLHSKSQNRKIEKSQILPTRFVSARAAANSRERRANRSPTN
jgi:hypothetical protein